MQALIIVLTVFLAILLILVVLVQKQKGGGLASSFSGSNQIMGVRRTNNFIEKTTWTLACAVAVLSIISVLISGSGTSTGTRTSVEKAQSGIPPITNENQNAQPIQIPAGQNTTPENAQ